MVEYKCPDSPAAKGRIINSRVDIFLCLSINHSTVHSQADIPLRVNIDMTFCYQDVSSGSMAFTVLFISINFYRKYDGKCLSN